MREQRRSAADGVTGDTKQIATEADAPISSGRRTWEWLRSVLVTIGLFLFIRIFLVEAFRIPTGSMEGTLLVGDFLLVNKALYGATVPGTARRLPAFAEPARGDVVVFVPPHDSGKNYVKRLVGMPGDTLEMHNATLYLNGRPLAEPFAHGDNTRDVYAAGMSWQCEHAPLGSANPCRPTRDNWGPVVVPAGRYFMLGDNRGDSEDSRFWGFVERDAIRGRPLFIYYSFEPTHRPLPWLAGIRWGRIGHGVH